MRQDAVYSVINHVHQRVIGITDYWRADRPTRTVTNDAEAVIAKLAAQGLLDDKPGYPPIRVIYRDTEKVWDEIVVKNGRFAGFAPIRATTIGDALAAIQNDRWRESIVGPGEANP